GKLPAEWIFPRGERVDKVIFIILRFLSREKRGRKNPEAFWGQERETGTPHSQKKAIFPAILRHFDGLPFAGSFCIIMWYMYVNNGALFPRNRQRRIMIWNTFPRPR
ncbi:MAG: hypothetical protein IKK98_01010, partial [Oscillospiraceae bacterium]|nr:hypothetical protein [Oscillospiraceae bacterium]